MRKLSVTIAALTVLGYLGSPVLEACGAKFLVATRVARLQRFQHAASPANILVYQHASDTDTAEFAAKLQTWLENVGHSVTIAAAEDELRDAARTNEFNLVMMGLEEARRLQASVTSWSPDLALLPITLYASRSDAVRATREFGHVLELPALTGAVLSTVHDAYTGG